MNRMNQRKELIIRSTSFLLVLLLIFSSCNKSEIKKTTLPPFECLSCGETGGIYEQVCSDGKLKLTVRMWNTDELKAMCAITYTWLEIPDKMYDDCISFMTSDASRLNIKPISNEIIYRYASGETELDESVTVGTVEQGSDDNGSFTFWKFDIDEAIPNAVSEKDLKEISIILMLEIESNVSVESVFNYGITYDQALREAIDTTVGADSRFLSRDT